MQRNKETKKTREPLSALNWAVEKCCALGSGGEATRSVCTSTSVLPPLQPSQAHFNNVSRARSLESKVRSFFVPQR